MIELTNQERVHSMLSVECHVLGRTRYGRMRRKGDCQVGYAIAALEEQVHWYLLQLGEVLPTILLAKLWSDFPPCCSS